jgi:uncharacterized protein
VTQYYLNKKKIINDPVFGFINLQSELVFDLIEHPYMQRLRRIKQLGLSFPGLSGANHSRLNMLWAPAFNAAGHCGFAAERA